MERCQCDNVALRHRRARTNNTGATRRCARPACNKSACAQATHKYARALCITSGRLATLAKTFARAN
eukprot:9877010-Alexandrium_andersonii.AAC.2